MKSIWQKIGQRLLVSPISIIIFSPFVIGSVGLKLVWGHLVTLGQWDVRRSIEAEVSFGQAEFRMLLVI